MHRATPNLASIAAKPASRENYVSAALYLLEDSNLCGTGMNERTSALRIHSACNQRTNYSAACLGVAVFSSSCSLR
jgi:hypothetical protein